MSRNKRGFTLVELLAVIVILAIILAIAVPTISSLIANQKRSAFAAGVKMLIKGVDYDILQNGTTGYGTLPTTVTATALGGSATDYPTISVTAISPVTVSVTGGGQFATCTTTGATFSAVTVTGC